jgi:quercetin dioxygenase-like cupin family protein
LKGQDNQVQESIVTEAAPWHTHPSAQEILYALEGEVTLLVDGQSVRSVKAGEIAITPADLRHSVRNDTLLAAKVLVVHSRADKEKPLMVVAKD